MLTAATTAARRFTAIVNHARSLGFPPPSSTAATQATARCRPGMAAQDRRAPPLARSAYQDEASCYAPGAIPSGTCRQEPATRVPTGEELTREGRCDPRLRDYLHDLAGTGPRTPFGGYAHIEAAPTL